ncbi:hypothetical protein [Ancylomarina sp. 16SWW S1-10-2]|uniref:hypothetical protein n=1 Tax=Ancylomarina sp. 16SWW S1-10-2 TaxID=2499681 RepID=UPI0012AD7E62|nr:hypothetical protein [Ancylomarina sp. 16SWW S1-10-2]MRT94761.1 hypothetical protein [Ancylomarina sp. 16SWW S1-10-2]
MDKYVIKLLFDYRGKINHENFKQGIIILFSLVIWDRLLFIINIIPNILIERLGVLELAQMKAFKFYTIPSLPILFVLFISSIVIVHKRFKEISNNSIFGLILGILVFLFFHSISISTSTNLLFSGITNFEISNSSRLFYLLSYSTSITLGITIMIFLANAKKNIAVEKSENNFGIQLFIRLIGKLLVYFLSGFGVIYLIYIIYPSWQFVSVSSAVILIVFITLYFRLALKRAKDAGIKNKLTWTILASTIILIAGFLVLSFITRQVVIHQLIEFLISAVIIVFEISNVFLFLLPSKDNDNIIG